MRTKILKHLPESRLALRPHLRTWTDARAEAGKALHIIVERDRVPERALGIQVLVLIQERDSDIRPVLALLTIDLSLDAFVREFLIR